MHYDALTVAAVATELQQVIEGGRVQQVLAVDGNSIGMEIYAQKARHYLLLNADPRNSRVHLVQEKLRRGVRKDSPLLLLLRKYVRGGQLTTVEQPDPIERLLVFHFSHPEHGITRLVAECITQRGNLILINEDNVILDSLRRAWASTGVERPLMPKHPYAPPPPQEKYAPFTHELVHAPQLSSSKLALLLQTEDTLWRLLIHHFAGVSPTLAREVAWRVTGSRDGKSNVDDAARILDVLSQLWAGIEHAGWQPGQWLEEGIIAGFAAYEIHGYDEFLSTPSISMAIERYFNQPAQPRPEEHKEEVNAVAAEASTQDGYQVLRRTVGDLLDKAEQRLQRQLAGLSHDEPTSGQAEELRLHAEWLLALQSQIAPEQQTLTVDLGERTLTIPLETEKGAVQQAEQMFNRAAKLERAAEFIPQRRAKLQEDLAYMEQLRLDLAQAENQPEIAAIQEELRAMGLLTAAPSGTSSNRTKQKGGEGSQPWRYQSEQGFQIVVGRNARQNEKVTFDIANAEDLWLHVRGAPGSHVVIRSSGQDVNEETLRMAAQLAAYHSKLTGENAATVIFTPRRFVSRAPGGRPGQVLVRQEETITVPARLPTEEIEG